MAGLRAASVDGMNNGRTVLHESRVVRPGRLVVLYSVIWADHQGGPPWPVELIRDVEGPVDIEERTLPDGEWRTVATSPDGFGKMERR